MKPGPKKQYQNHLTLRVSEHVMEQLRRKAQEMGISLSEFLRLALGECVDAPSNEEKSDGN